MTDRAAFVAAIEADPDADLPRLQWADWLDDHGDARDRVRAKLVRVQCELARRPSAALEQRAAGLLAAVARAWPVDLLPPARRHIDVGRFLRRGCLHGLPVADTAFLETCASHAGREPLLAVDLIAYQSSHALAGHPELGRVGEVYGGGFAPLFAGPELAGVRAVRTSDPADLGPVLDSPAAFDLRSLAVHGTSDAPDGSPLAVARLLSGSARLGRLERLRLDAVGFEPIHWRILMQSPHLSAGLTLAGSEAGRMSRGSPLVAELFARFRWEGWP